MEGKQPEVIHIDNEFKKRIIFIRHGNSIWNKMKGQGTKSKISAIGQGVLEFAKTSYYDTTSHKSSTVMDAPLSDIGIKQCKALSKFLPKRYKELENEIFLANNYIDSHNKCNKFVVEASKLLNDILLPINSNTDNGGIVDDNHSDLAQIQEYLNKAKLEMNSSMNEYNKKILTDIDKLENLLSIVSVLLSSSSDSIIVCSNLRRAMSTSIIAFWDRFKSNKTEYLYMMPCLQEIGYGVDSISHNDTGKVAKESHINRLVKSINNYNYNDKTVSYKPENDKIELSTFEEECDELNMLNNLKSDVNVQKMRRFYDKRLKTMKINTGLGRMSDDDIKKKDKQENRKESDKKIELFMDWVFNDKSNEMKKTIVAIGHSGWIRAFFNKYMHDTDYHDLKTNKIKNCGVVSLDIYRNYHFKNNKVNQYSIIPSSITIIYQGSL